MGTLVQDIRYAIRGLVQRPGLASVIVLTLALGIAACTVVFSLIYGLMFRPLAFDSEGRLAVILETDSARGLHESKCRYENFVDWRDQSTSFDTLAAYHLDHINVAGTEEPVRTRAIRASDGIFRVLGVQPLIGRVFGPEEDHPGAERVALIGDAFWKAYLNSDPAVLGRSLTIQGDVHAVIGVVPSVIDPSREALPALDVWLPLAREYDRAPDDTREARSLHNLTVLGPRKAGVSLSEVRTELAAVAKRLERAHPDSNSGRGVRVKTVQRSRLSDGGELALKFLGLAVALVLCVACFNVANLLLARAASRSKEMALRSALGASRGRLVRQLLTESAIVAIIAGLFGALLAFWGVQALFVLSAEAQNADPATHPVRVDRLALGFSLAAALATVVLFGLFPALQTVRCDVSHALKEGTRTTGITRRGHRLRGALVAGQIAFAIVLVASTSLVIQSFLSLQKLDPGYDLRGLLAANISLPEASYQEEHRRSAFLSQTLAQLERLPEVTSAAASDSPPLSRAPSIAVAIEGHRGDERGRRPEAAVSTVTAGYWATMGIPISAGRGFFDGDDADATSVAVVNETFAKKHWPGEDALGRRLKLGRYDDSASPWRTIVGVAGDSRQWAQEYEVDPQVFVPYRQSPRLSMVLLARTTRGNAEALGLALRGAVETVDPDQPVFDIRSMEASFDREFASWQLFGGLLAVFSLVALVLAAVGIYGAVSYMVSQRTHEIGVRTALGAQTRDVVKLVLRQGGLLAVVGLGVGLPCAVAVAHLLAHTLYRVTATDMPTLIGVALLLAAVSLLACYIPARRATKVDPMVALRYE